jgi:hypothetical protein
MSGRERFGLKTLFVSIQVSLLLVITVAVTGCGGYSQAEIDFYEEIEELIIQTNSSLDDAAELVSEASRNSDPSMEMIALGIVSETAPSGSGSELTAEETQSMMNQFDMLETDLSAKLDFPDSPEECEGCSDFISSIEDPRSKAVAELQKASAVFSTTATVESIRDIELQEITAIPMPYPTTDISAVAAPWEQAKASYEKAQAAYQALSPEPSLKEDMDALIAVQQEVTEATQAEISAMSSFDNNLILQTQNDAFKVSNNELNDYRKLIYSAAELLRGADANLLSMALEMDDLLEEIPDDLES